MPSDILFVVTRIQKLAFHNKSGVFRNQLLVEQDGLESRRRVLDQRPEALLLDLRDFDPVLPCQRCQTVLLEQLRLLQLVTIDGRASASCRFPLLDERLEQAREGILQQGNTVEACPATYSA